MAQGGVLGVHTRVGFSPTLSPLSYTKINNLLNCVIPGLEPDKIDTSRHGSLMKRNMPGMTDVSEMELTILQDLDESTSPEQDALFDLNAAGTTVPWRVEVPNQRGAPTSWTPFTFTGWVKSFRPGTAMGEKQTLICTVVFDDTEFTKGAAAASVIG